MIHKYTIVKPDTVDINYIYALVKPETIDIYIYALVKLYVAENTSPLELFVIALAVSSNICS